MIDSRSCYRYWMHFDDYIRHLLLFYETSDTKGVLDGDLDGLMAATLATNVSGKSRADAKSE